MDHCNRSFHPKFQGWESIQHGDTWWMFFFQGGFRLGRISTATFAPSAEWAETLLLLAYPQMHEGYVTSSTLRVGRELSDPGWAIGEIMELSRRFLYWVIHSESAAFFEFQGVLLPCCERRVCHGAGWNQILTFQNDLHTVPTKYKATSCLSLVQQALFASSCSLHLYNRLAAEPFVRACRPSTSWTVETRGRSPSRAKRKTAEDMSVQSVQNNRNDISFLHTFRALWQRASANVVPHSGWSKPPA